MLTFAIVLLLAGLSLGDANWAFTEVATADGQPCLADCKDGQCIVDSSGYTKTCISSGIKPLTFRTAQFFDFERNYCLSNCGSFGTYYEWCYTSEKGNWDICNSSPDDRSFLMTKCEQPCTFRTTGYYMCGVGNEKWDPCAPPATTNEPNVDANKAILGFQKVLMKGYVNRLSHSGDAKWAYTEVATADGQPCLADCKDGQCIVDSSGNNKTCISSGIKPPTFRTAQLFDYERNYCLSNCGSFGTSYDWCLTSEEGHFDFCNSSPDDRSFAMNKCDQPCTKITSGYLCYLGNEKWEYCAPPATTNEPNIDAELF